MIQIWLQVFLTILGGLIAGAAGLFVNWKGDVRKNKNLRKLLITGICDDLELSLHLYDKISDEFEKTKIVWFSTLNELRESRQTYKNNRDFITIFDDEKLRVDIFRYYNSTGDIIGNLEYQEKRRMVLDNNFKNAVSTHMRQHPKLTNAQAEKEVLEINKAETHEYQMLTTDIPATIQKLKEFKSVAIELIRRLKDK
jgi:hypothetical protein